jgi:phage terminase large subunit-like protein
MGLRGIGSRPVRKTGEGVERKPEAWENPYLTRAERVIVFLESLPVTSGIFAGTKFKVRDFQRNDILLPTYAVDKNEKRIVRQVVITMGRKNGKTGLIAGLALCHLAGPEVVDRGQLYCAAAERNQAGLIYNEMKAMIDQMPALRNRIIVRDFQKKLEDVETGSVFLALSSDAKTKHGFNTSFMVFDELAQVRDQKLYEALVSSTGAREEPLIIVISTQSPDPNHIMSVLVDEAKRVRDGEVIDPTLLPVIYETPMEADAWDEANWPLANPALGDFRSLEEMRDYASKAKRMPSLEGSFRNLYLNQRIQEEKSFMPKALWNACAGRVVLDELKGRPCHGALDLSATKNDLTAMVLDFDVDGKQVCKTFFWKPEEGMEDSERRDHVPYALWVNQGWIEAIPGPIIDYRWLAYKIGELNIQYKIKAIACDRWHLPHLKKEMDEIGLDLTLIEYGQGFQDFSAAVTALEDAVLTKTLVHENSPVLNWNIDSVKVVQDAAGNRKFDKRKATGRIDGAVALAMACGIKSTLEPDSDLQVFFVG